MRTVLFLVAAIICLSTLAAQEVPRLLLREHQGDYFYLKDSLRVDRNYVLTTTFNACTWCKKAFEEWTNCYDSLGPLYNVEIIAISSDGYEYGDQVLGVQQIKNIGLPIKIWFTEYDSIKTAFPEVFGSPTNLYIGEGGIYLGKVGGYAECDVFQDSLATYFEEHSYTDADGDGYTDFFDCNDSDAEIHPGAMEIRYNGIDDDCDHSTRDDDIDGDGYLLKEDCDDLLSSVYPGAEEICNFRDDNCDGFIDEGFEIYEIWWDEDLDGYGDLNFGRMSCTNVHNGWVSNSDDCDDQNRDINPSAVEIPNNGVDENCDGLDFISTTNEIIGVHYTFYPNPTSDVVNIKHSGAGSFYVDIIDSKGNKLESFDSPQTIDLSKCEKGLYFFRIMDYNSEHIHVVKCLKL